ncbi:hypothetical protein [Aureimonas mangrovi]|uniref:hypothetical protein n=1 Tax=Aureimonas mangrovi TaxID=2758041 RepID=UPI001AEE21E7|nr:hypothetical protein [Aureimonas mangrovi]
MSALTIEDRRLGYEAKRFALETLVKIYIEHTNGSRALLMSHARIMLTLAIAAMAGFITVYAAMLRSNPAGLDWIEPIPAFLALSGLALIVTSALLSSRALSLAAKVATDLLRDPFPTAQRELREMFDAKNEDIVLSSLVATIQLHIADTAPKNNHSVYATMSLIAGTILAAASLVVSFVMPVS